ncbi:MAG: phosphate acyltransferase PlsX [Gammaproteobacteria bacterium]|nr:phosphate acyltransferase PlsX [Gammaproteobacteria bacterium]HJL80541.1 phosphate acyltransferase PlsX [Gammaproteobacteria bacterium]HJM09419.1 phosphate acyltransferase PlsX [Gammaproteobacteria bacterium]HJN01382.1 phosphate acyltransferase PlsX [Gammaproteobacteria bacterium]
MSIHYKLALDIMSGERDPLTSIDAAIEALKNDDALQLSLVGDESIVMEHFPKELMPRVDIVHTTEVVSMDDAPIDALRKKKNSSMRLAVNLVSEGMADACVSSGNTGALMANAKYVLKTLPSIDRPAFMKAIPTKGDYTYMLDLGANSTCTAEQLYQFALMGDVVAREIKGISEPKIALLNIGEEEIKGHEMIKEASTLLEQSSINYVGYVEGNDIVENKADVIVTDGFTGNIAIKAMEGTIELMTSVLKESISEESADDSASDGSKFALDIFKKSIDPRKHNGALLVGLNGIVVKSHGSSDSYGHYHAILTAVNEVKKEIIPKLIETLEEKTA